MREFETKFIGRLSRGVVAAVALTAGVLEQYETGRFLTQAISEKVDDLFNYIEDKYPDGLDKSVLKKYWPRWFYCSTIMVLYSIEKTYPDVADLDKLGPRLVTILEDLKPVWTCPEHKFSFPERKLLGIFQLEGLLTDNPEV